MDFSDAWNAFAGKLAELLPQSPTLDSESLEEVARFAGYINFIFPVGKFLLFVAGMLAAIAVYYLAMVILRWIRLIG